MGTVLAFLVVVEISGEVSSIVVCFSVTLPGSDVAGNVGVEPPACAMCPVPLFVVGSWVCKLISFSAGGWMVRFSVPAEVICWVWFKSGVWRYSVTVETFDLGVTLTVCTGVSIVVGICFLASATVDGLCISLAFVDVMMGLISLFILRDLKVAVLLKVSSKTKTDKQPSMLATIAICTKKNNNTEIVVEKSAYVTQHVTF